MWRRFANCIAQWTPNCHIVYDKFYLLQHANKAIDEVRRAESFSWMNLDTQKRQELNHLFALNRRVMTA